MRVPEPKTPGRIASFHVKLLVGMMLVVSTVAGLGLYFAQRNAAASAERDLRREFQSELAALHRVQALRHAALAERCQELARKPRIHAALEDDALDLLYPSAQDELRDLMTPEDDAPAAPSALRARFYRFLDEKGALIPPPDTNAVGKLTTAEEARLALHAAPHEPQMGYLLRKSAASGETLDEIIAMPIFSMETGQAIAAIAVGFKPVEPGGAGIASGIWLDGSLHLPALANSAQAALSGEVSRVIAASGEAESSFNVVIEGAPHLAFYKLLNPGSHFPPAYEVCVYSLAGSLARQRQLRWQILGAGGLLLLGGLAASHFVSARLSAPVEKLAVESAADRAQRERAEAALELTHKELQRSARFSADASHQLKTPVTVLRAGLEELLTHENLTHEMRDEISALIHQTFRLTSIVEDLLLLSRMDAGRLQIDFCSVNLTQLVEAKVDDLSALPDALDVEVDADCLEFQVAGEKRYVALILQNLLENARKYNRPGGRIRIACREEGDRVFLTIGNTGRTIPPGAQKHIFERFHRAAIGEDVPGHGLGLNLARELARLHGGDLRLARSGGDWTEFEVSFRLARQGKLKAVETA